MSKKYLVLKRKVPKAGNGWLSSAKDAWNDMGEDEQDSLKGQGMNIASDLATNALSGAFENANEKNKNYDGYGNPIFGDEERKRGTRQGFATNILGDASKGFARGFQTGGIWGGIIGGVGGLITGTFKGFKNKKLMARKQEETDTLMTANLRGTGRANDQAALQSIQSNSVFDNNAFGDDPYGENKLNPVATGKKGIKLGTISIPKEKAKSLVLRSGGKLEEPGEINVVVKGKLHRENNNLGNKDKGIPVIDSKGVKEYEVESGEVIFRRDVTDIIEKYTDAYKKTNNDDLLIPLGEAVAVELLDNTKDNYGKFGASVKDDETQDG